MEKNTDIKFLKTNTINNLHFTSNKSNILCKDVEESIKCVVPNWPLRVGFKQINSKQKPPHLRSKVNCDIIIKLITSKCVLLILYL